MIRTGAETPSQFIFASIDYNLSRSLREKAIFSLCLRFDIGTPEEDE
jgi:hypothetical protein